MIDETMINQMLKRMDNLDNEMREMRKAITQLARTEERVAVVIEQNTILFKRMDELRTKVNELEKTNISQDKSIGFFEKTGWLIAGAVSSGLGALFTYFF